MSQDKSDFMARLEAMRAGKEVQRKIETPSLKERLQARDAARQGPDTTAADDMRARIQAKFRNKAQAPSVGAPGAVETPAAPSSEPEAAPELDLKRTELPKNQASQDDEAKTWTPEHGGSCPSCDTFNLGHVVFCGNCNYMLTKSEVVVEIISSYPLKEIPGVVHTFIDKLAKFNIKTTEDLLRTGNSHPNRVKLAKQTGMSEKSLLKLVHQSDMCRIPSFEPQSAGIMDLLNINTLSELLSHKPGALYKKIQQGKIKLNQAGIMFLPTKSQVARWLEEGAELAAVKIV